MTQPRKNDVVIIDVTECEVTFEKLELFTDIQIAEAQVKQGKGKGHDDAKNIVLDRIQIIRKKRDK